MPALNEIYAKFGEAAEAGQLLETELGNLLLADAIKLHGVDKVRDKSLAHKIVEEVDRKTLGQLIGALRKRRPVPANFEAELGIALTERNRLNHYFYRQHNLRKTTEPGRQLMLADLEVIHDRILQAYMTALSLSDIQITKEALDKAQSGHLPL